MPDIVAVEETGWELTFQIPLSEIYKFNGPEKARELAETFEAGRQKPAAMAPIKRFTISTIGIFCLMIGLTGAFGRNPNIFSFLWVVLGTLIIWFFLAKPEMDRRRAGSAPDTKKNPEVTLVVNPGRIVIRSPHNETAREWTEFVEHRKTKKGIRLHFLDGTTIWLPEEAFYDRNEMNELLQLLQKKTITNDQIPMTR